MPAVTSADGTVIVYERAGSGTPSLSTSTTAVAGGESADTAPYAVAREVEDLQAVLAQAGGEAYVYGMSSEAALVLAAAAADPGQTHDVSPDVLAPVLVDFFGA